MSSGAGVPRRVLTIAGSDSGGGAGIEADLKVFTALGVYGMAALTSVTAQNTVGVRAIQDLSPEIVAQQIDAVAEDIGIDAAKTGMLSNAAIIEAVAESVARNHIPKLVVDPVMISKSGARLLREDACEILKRSLLPLAWLVTPNVPEAEALTGIRIEGMTGIERAATRILELGPRYVLLKGGHLDGPESVDYLFDGKEIQTFQSPRVPTRNTHGTGCTLSAAITANLAKGSAIEMAIQEAKAYLINAIIHGFSLGKGHGPLNHFWNRR